MKTGTGGNREGKMDMLYTGDVRQHCINQERAVFLDGYQRSVDLLTKGRGDCNMLQVRSGNTFSIQDDIPAIHEGDITNFRNGPDFDLIFFTFLPNLKPDQEMIAKFQYCRMLLKPGGMLALLLPYNKRRPWWSLALTGKPFFSAVDRENFSVSLLKRAGLARVRQIPYKNFGMIISGYRRQSYGTQGER